MEEIPKRRQSGRTRGDPEGRPDTKGGEMKRSDVGVSRASRANVATRARARNGHGVTRRRAYLTRDDRAAPAAVHGDDARRRGARRSPSTGRARCPAPSTTAAARRRSRSARRSRSRPRTGCASCTATSARTSSAGVTPDRYLANYMGRAGGVTGGKDGNMHFGDRDARLRRDGLDAARHGARRDAGWRWRSRCAASRAWR